MRNIQLLFKRVIEINDLVGNTCQPTEQTWNHQAMIIASEVDELVEGLRTENRHEIRDGIADVLFTVAGMYGRIGLKLPEPKSVPAPDHDVDVWRYVDALLRAKKTLIDFHELGLPADEQLEDLTELCEQLGIIHGFPVEDDLQAVIDSNWSKFDHSFELAQETKHKYDLLGILTELHGVIDTAPADGSRSSRPAIYVTFSAADQIGFDQKHYPKGKWLKSVNFREPRFTN